MLFLEADQAYPLDFSGLIAVWHDASVIEVILAAGVVVCTLGLGALVAKVIGRFYDNANPFR